MYLLGKLQCYLCYCYLYYVQCCKNLDWQFHVSPRIEIEQILVNHVLKAQFLGIMWEAYLNLKDFLEIFFFNHWSGFKNSQNTLWALVGRKLAKKQKTQRVWKLVSLPFRLSRRFVAKYWCFNKHFATHFYDLWCS